MSHDLVTSADGSQVSFVNAGAHQIAWHTLGTHLPAQIDGATALKLGGLDYLVEKMPQTVTVMGDTLNDAGELTFETLVSPDVALVRKDIYSGRYNIVGTASPSYEIVQNHELVPFLDTIVGESGAHYTTAGELKSGARVFISLKLPQSVKIGGVDPVDLYLVASTSHDASSALKCHVTTVRTVCGNTYAAGVRNAKASFSMPHTANIRQRMALAQEALGISVNYLTEFESIANNMYDTPMDVAEFDAMVDTIWAPRDWSKDKTSRGFTINAERKAMMRVLFSNAPTNEIGRGTRWAAFNAVTEYADHYATGAANKSPSAARDAEVRNATRVMTDGLKSDGKDVKAHAMALLS